MSNEFMLTYMVPVIDDMNFYLDRLVKAKCSDAVTGLADGGRLTLDFFDRDGPNISEIIEHAVNSISREIPEAKLIDVSPDLVGITELAAMLEVSRQAVRKMWEKNISHNFPAPVKYGNGKSPIWNMASVLHWMDKSDKYDTPNGMLEASKAAMRANVIRAQEKLEELGVVITPEEPSQAATQPMQDALLKKYDTLFDDTLLTINWSNAIENPKSRPSERPRLH